MGGWVGGWMGPRLGVASCSVWADSIDVAHSIGVQNGGLHFFCLQEPIFNVLVFFLVLKLEVYVCLVKGLLILSFYLSKQLKESPRTQNLGVKRL